MGEVDQAESDRKALEALVVNNTDLERLEALLGRFNIFEAVGLVRQEIRHSAFLAFLLDPRQNHGLRDTFLKRLLQEAIMSSPDASAPVTPIELSLWDLNQIEVRREWQHIDIFLLDERNRLAVIIENKIGTGEHSDQLRRYHEVVEQHYTNCKVISLYLTPTGDEPSHEAYLPLGYGLVCEVLDSLAQGQASVSNPDLQVLVAHYTQMLRRHIVGDSEVARLCRQIYQKHQQALDLIYEHRPDVPAEVKGVLEDLIKSEPGLKRDSGGKNLIRFVPQEWDVPALLTGNGWTKSGRIMMFEFWNNSDNLTLSLALGPGPDEIRQKLFSMARANLGAFQEPQKTAGAWRVVYLREFLDGTMYENAIERDREQAIREHWDGFLEIDLPRIDEALRKEDWIWE